MAHLLRSRATPDLCYTPAIPPAAALRPHLLRASPNALARLEVGAGVALEPGVVHGAIRRPATDLTVSPETLDRR